MRKPIITYFLCLLCATYISAQEPVEYKSRDGISAKFPCKPEITYEEVFIGEMTEMKCHYKEDLYQLRIFLVAEKDAYPSDFFSLWDFFRPSDENDAEYWQRMDALNKFMDNYFLRHRLTKKTELPYPDVNAVDIFIKNEKRFRDTGYITHKNKAIEVIVEDNFEKQCEMGKAFFKSVKW